MRNLKKTLAVLLAIAMIATCMVPAFAAETTFSYEKEAKDLYDLNLYKGTDPTSYVPNLEGKLDRQTGVVMLLRMFGQEEDALALTDAEATAKLATVTDAATIADWAKKQVAYAVEKGYVKGFPDGSFKPTADLNGKAYSSLILQQLGYGADFNYATAAFDLSEKGGLTKEQATAFNSEAGINRDAMVGISYGAMTAKYKSGETTVIGKLVELGKVDKAKAKAMGFPVVKVKSVATLEPVSVAIGGTAELPAKVLVTFEDDTTAEVSVVWPTVDTAAAGEKEIEGTVGKYDVKAKVKVIIEEDKLTAKKITATNLKEIVVEFSKTLDEKSAESKGNYELDEESLAEKDEISLNDDGKSVTIKFATAFENHSDIELLVEDVKDASGKAMEEAVTLKAKISDTTFPEVKEIKLTGPDTFKLIFSEPIDASEGGSIDFDDGVYSVDFDDASTGSEITCTIATDDIDEGEYEVVIEDFKDFAGYMMADKTFKLKYAIDKSDITATLKEVKQDKVKVVFNKGVVDEDGNALTVDFFYHTFSDYNPNTLKVNDDKTEYELFFDDHKLPEGTLKIVVKNKADIEGGDDDVKVEDVWGNELKADLVLSTTVTADNTKPTISSIEPDDDDETILYINFSEAIDEEEATDEDNYLFKDKDGEEVTPESIEYSDDDDEYKVTVTFDEDLSGDYSVEVKNMKDTSVAENVMETVTKNFKVKDVTAVDFSKVEVYSVEGESDDYIYVYFDEDMDKDSVLDKNNYLVGMGNTFKKLGDKDKVEIFRGDKSKVKITLKDGIGKKSDSFTQSIEATVPASNPVEGIYDLSIGRVKDAAGNTPDDLSYRVNILPDEAPEIKEIKTLDSNKLMIVVNKPIVAVNAKGISVAEEVYSDEEDFVAISRYVMEENDDNETEITVTLSGIGHKLANPADTTIAVKISDDAFKSETNKYVAGYTEDIIADGWAPSFDKIEVSATTGEVIMTFDEELDFADGINLFAAELKVVDKDGDKLVAVKDYTIAASLNDAGNTVITLELTDDEYEGRLKISAKDVKFATDLNENELEDMDEETVTIK